MFSKGKSALKLLENNAILSHFDVGRLYASGGPESVWKIYEGVAKADGKVSFFENFLIHFNFGITVADSWTII
jgi:hypothetical protein